MCVHRELHAALQAEGSWIDIQAGHPAAPTKLLCSEFSPFPAPESLPEAPWSCLVCLPGLVLNHGALLSHRHKPSWRNKWDPCPAAWVPTRWNLSWWVLCPTYLRSSLGSSRHGRANSPSVDLQLCEVQGQWHLSGPLGLPPMEGSDQSPCSLGKVGEKGGLPFPWALPETPLHTEPSWKVIPPSCLMLSPPTQPAGRGCLHAGSWIGEEAVGPRGNWRVRH